jgi:transcriptional regulator with XRE-family HTH domain
MAQYTEVVARAVSDAMAERGQSQRAVSLATGIPRPTLTRRLNAHSSFTVAELERIAAFLDVEVADFLAPTEPAA